MDFNFQRITGVLILFLIVSIGGNVTQYFLRERHEMMAQERIEELETSKQMYQQERDSYARNIENIDSVDAENRLQTKSAVANFCLVYFTFSTTNEERRIQNVTPYVTESLEERMRRMLDTEANSGHFEVLQYQLTASDVRVYIGNPNEYLATFRVIYESHDGSESIKIYTMRLKMEGEKVNDFTILAIQDEGEMVDVW